MNCPYLHQKGNKKIATICKFFKQGNCPQGDNCKFTHDQISEPPSQIQSQQETQPSTLNLNAQPFQPTSSLSEQEQKKQQVLEKLKQRKIQQNIEQERKNSSPERIAQAQEPNKDVVSINKISTADQVKELLQKRKEEQIKQKQDQKLAKQQKNQKQKDAQIVSRQVIKVAGEAPPIPSLVENSQTRTVVSGNNQPSEPIPQQILGKRNEKDESNTVEEEIKEEDSNKRRKLEDSQSSQTLFKSLEGKDLEMKDQSETEQIKFKQIRTETQIQDVKQTEEIDDKFRGYQEEFIKFAQRNENNLRLDDTSGLDRDLDRLGDICPLSKDIFDKKEFDQNQNRKLFLFIDLNQLPAKYNTQVGKKGNKPLQVPVNPQIQLKPQQVVSQKEEQQLKNQEQQKSPLPSLMEEPPKVLEPSIEQKKLISQNLSGSGELLKPTLEQEENKDQMPRLSSNSFAQIDVEMKDQNPPQGLEQAPSQEQDNVEENQVQQEKPEVDRQKTPEQQPIETNKGGDGVVVEQPRDSNQEMSQQQSNVQQNVQEEEEKKEPATQTEQIQQASQPSSQVAKKKITIAEIEQEIKEFNALMDQICQMLDFQPQPHQEDPDLENLVSFGTRVEVIGEYFETKAPQVVQEIKNLLQ